jgi:hypothetical protein
MSFKKSGSSNIKSFVSEEEAQDDNEKRQQEWERVRQPDDPLGKSYMIHLQDYIIKLPE